MPRIGPENPPKRASSEELELLCEEAASGKEEKVLADTVDLSEDKTSRVVRYGRLLGFLTVEDDIISTTTKGDELVLTSRNEELENLFLWSIHSYETYEDLSNKLATDVLPGTDEGYLARPDVMKVLKIDFGIELTQDPLERAGKTYLQTLSAAGFGEYKQGSSANPSRLVFSDGQKKRFLNEFQDDTNEGRDGTRESSDSQVDQSEEGAGQPFAPVVSSTPESMERPLGTAPEISANLDVTIDLSTDDNPDQVRALFAAIREGLEGDSTDDEASEDITETDEDAERSEQSGDTEEQIIDDQTTAEDWTD